MSIFVPIPSNSSVTEGTPQVFFKVGGLKFLDFPSRATVVENLFSQKGPIFSKKFLKMIDC